MKRFIALPFACGDYIPPHLLAAERIATQILPQPKRLLIPDG